MTSDKQLRHSARTAAVSVTAVLYKIKVTIVPVKTAALSATSVKSKTAQVTPQVRTNVSMH